MQSYLSYVVEYLHRMLWRMDTLLGAIALIAIFVLAQFVFSAEPSTILKIELAALAVAFLESGYGVFREERVMRSQRESAVRIEARMSTYGLNTRNPALDEIDIQATVAVDIWTDVDIDTSVVGLNLVGDRNRRWKNLWLVGRARKKPLMRINPEKQDSPTYRKKVLASDPQPRTEFIKFDWRGKFVWEDPFDYELVLILGHPALTLRVKLDNKLSERGSNRPL